MSETQELPPVLIAQLLSFLWNRPIHLHGPVAAEDALMQEIIGALLDGELEIAI
jgi:hypothetical protein